ncbi:MAG: hypothetical protein MUP16_10595 [Sedimentisphaerales bacterium]|jgi:hypothetical protein|nr:hypothetical protein [Sedimentisphaerales bacterium]
MSPNGQTGVKKIKAPSNIYTIILAIAAAVILSTVVFVAYSCYTQYETIFQIP